MDRRERERIMGEHQPRGLSAREQREAELLAADLTESPLSGKPLPRRMRNFSASVEGYARSVVGPPAYAQRLRQIEEEIDDHLDRLRAARWNFHAVNQLIEKHNRWYPAEARLPMNPRTGDFVLVGGEPYRRELLDAAWILRRFPPAGPEHLAA
jgi:hypothetical protein